jgi:Tfp pilus assembly protein PilE
MTGDRRDEGFTVIELVIAIIIVTIIVVPITSSVILGMASTERAQQRTTDSTDQQVLASYFVNDVQSADTVTAGTSGCGASAALRLDWNEAQPLPATPGTFVGKTVVYSFTSSNELQRLSCDTAGNSKTVLVVNAMAAAPVPSCDGATCPTSVQACASASPSTCPAVTLDDAATTNASTTVTSASAAFNSAYVGGTVTGPGIPAGDKVAAAPSATSLTLTAPASATSAKTTIWVAPPWKPRVVTMPITAVGTTTGQSQENYSFTLSATRRMGQ